MVEIDLRGFRGDRDELSKFLRERSKHPVSLERRMIRIGDDRAASNPSVQEVKDLVRRALHRMGEDDYRVIVQSGTVVIREKESREHHLRSKGSVPSVRDSVPYFFPG